MLSFLNNLFGDVIADLTYINENYLGGILANLTLLNMLLLSLERRGIPFPRTSNTFQQQYDYIIVGAGTAGSVMANRLSQKPCVRVLLLEAGGQPTILSEIPAMQRMLFSTDIDWLYKTTPQKYCCSKQNERRVNWNSGKALGGGSVLNSMLYVRGNKKNYDDWEAEGCTGWSYNDVLPYFIKLEDHQRINEVDEGFHGRGGPMTIDKPRYTAEIKNPLWKALTAMGYEITDPNGRRQTGIYDLQGTLRNGQRCSTAKAYLVPADDRENLTILKRAYARKIIMEGTRAVGVEFEFNSELHRVYATEEVIVSSGTVRTPQLLMLSGIGPREELEKFNIPVVVDLPSVGKNLQDHVSSQLVFKVDPQISSIFRKIVNPKNIMEYILNRSGSWTSPSMVSLMAFVDSLSTSQSVDFPRQELYFAEYSVIDTYNYNINQEVYSRVYAPHVGQTLYTCIVSNCQTCSFGEITLNSADPDDPPLINPNYYQCKQDLDDVVKGLKLCYAVGTSEAMKELKSQSFPFTFPGCEHLEFNLTAYFECQARSVVSTFWHPIGTARCGQPGDPRSVVDPQLRVIGTTGLRVVNAAIMPIIPSGNTNIPTMMVAEKAYDMMKDDKECVEQPKRFPFLRLFG